MGTQEPGGSFNTDAYNTVSPYVFGSVLPRSQKQLEGSSVLYLKEILAHNTIV